MDRSGRLRRGGGSSGGPREDDAAFSSAPGFADSAASTWQSASRRDGPRGDHARFSSAPGFANSAASTWQSGSRGGQRGDRAAFDSSPAFAVSAASTRPNSHRDDYLEESSVDGGPLPEDAEESQDAADAGEVAEFPVGPDGRTHVTFDGRLQRDVLAERSASVEKQQELDAVVRKEIKQWWEQQNISVDDVVVHPKRGKGVVKLVTSFGSVSGAQRVHVEFRGGEVHRYRRSSWFTKMRKVDDQTGIDEALRVFLATKHLRKAEREAAKRMGRGEGSSNDGAKTEVERGAAWARAQLTLQHPVGETDTDGVSSISGSESDRGSLQSPGRRRPRRRRSSLRPAELEVSQRRRRSSGSMHYVTPEQLLHDKEVCAPPSSSRPLSLPPFLHRLVALRPLPVCTRARVRRAQSVHGPHSALPSSPTGRLEPIETLTL